MNLGVNISALAGSFTLDIEFEMKSQTAALVGPSGAGKTLTLRTIAGLLSPDYGSIVVNGTPLYDSERSINIPARNRHIGYMFQDYALFPHLTVADNIAFGLQRTEHPKNEMLVTQAIKNLQIGGLEHRFPGTLSGGERQRVALGRALVTQPRLLLLDEPFSALDMPTRTALTEEFLQLRTLTDVPMLLVTHDVGEAYALCDELILLDHGRVLQCGTKASVFNRPSSPHAARLVGVQNLLTGSVTAVNAGLAIVETAGMRIATDSTFDIGTTVQVGFRSNAVDAVPRTGGDASLVRSIDRGTQLNGIFLTSDGTRIVATMKNSSEELLPRDGWHLTVRDPTTMVWPISEVDSYRYGY